MEPTMVNAETVVLHLRRRLGSLTEPYATMLSLCLELAVQDAAIEGFLKPAPNANGHAAVEEAKTPDAPSSR